MSQIKTINLNDFRKNDLIIISRELGLKIPKNKKKAVFITEIEKFNQNEKNLINIIKKHELIPKFTTTSKKTSIKSKNTIDFNHFKALETRVDNIETQIKFIIEKINSLLLSNTVYQKETGEIITEKEIIKIKKILMRAFSRGSSFSVDEIFQLKELKLYSFDTIEKVILRLIDDGIFEGTDGTSSIKIDKYIGRIIYP